MKQLGKLNNWTHPWYSWRWMIVIAVKHKGLWNCLVNVLTELTGLFHWRHQLGPWGRLLPVHCCAVCRVGCTWTHSLHASLTTLRTTFILGLLLMVCGFLHLLLESFSRLSWANGGCSVSFVNGLGSGESGRALPLFLFQDRHCTIFVMEFIFCFMCLF